MGLGLGLSSRTFWVPQRTGEYVAPPPRSRVEYIAGSWAFGGEGVLVATPSASHEEGVITFAMLVHGNSTTPPATPAGWVWLASHAEGNMASTLVCRMWEGGLSPNIPGDDFNVAFFRSYRNVSIAGPAQVVKTGGTSASPSLPAIDFEGNRFVVEFYYHRSNLDHSVPDYYSIEPPHNAIHKTSGWGRGFFVDRGSSGPLGEEPIVTERTDGYHAYRLALGESEGAIEEVDLVDLYAALNGGSLPTYRHPSDTYVTEASATLADTTRWRAQTNPGGLISFSGGKVTIPAYEMQQVVRLTLENTIPAGSRVRVWWRRTGGSGQMQPRLGPSNQNVVNNTLVQHGWFSADVTVETDKTFLEFRVPGNTGDVEFDHVCVETVDISTSLDIIILAGQSNMVGASSGTPPNVDIDLPHPDVWAMHGSTQTGFAAIAGEISGATAPLQHRSINTGFGPGLPFARWYAEHRLAAGRKVLVLCTAEGGTSLVSGGWNKNGPNPSLYNAMIADAQAALALNPAENRVVAVFWCQGESDRGVVSSAAYPAEFAELVEDVRGDLGDPTIPFVISGINPYTEDNPASSAVMISLQRGLAEGQPSGIPGVHYSGWDLAWGNGTKPTPDNILDTVHFGSDANRVRGIAAAMLLP